ncbi:hypothetical protein E2C01_092133 [Portunus trituberculatus]|uniref:Uncharacterized protein n=1 Tax=Portunus trituberculatus TaxID=210409 RepID=A0A5B7JWY7_PORTR|nr:hypothetical protein [Portunus trituberculatus]
MLCQAKEGDEKGHGGEHNDHHPHHHNLHRYASPPNLCPLAAPTSSLSVFVKINSSSSFFSSITTTTTTPSALPCPTSLLSSGQQCLDRYL